MAPMVVGEPQDPAAAGVLAKDGIATTIAPEDLKNHVAKDDNTDRGFSRHLAGLEIAFGEFSL